MGEVDPRLPKFHVSIRDGWAQSFEPRDINVRGTTARLAVIAALVGDVPPHVNLDGATITVRRI